jgi:hypothetical protein
MRSRYYHINYDRLKEAFINQFLTGLSEFEAKAKIDVFRQSAAFSQMSYRSSLAKSKQGTNYKP